MLDATDDSCPWFQRLVSQPTALTFGSRTQARDLFGTLCRDHSSPSIPEKKKTEATQWCLPEDWCVRFRKNATRVAGPLQNSALRVSMDNAPEDFSFHSHHVDSLA